MGYGSIPPSIEFEHDDRIRCGSNGDTNGLDTREKGESYCNHRAWLILVAVIVCLFLSAVSGKEGYFSYYALVLSSTNRSKHDDKEAIINTKSLILLRHAKSSWKNATFIDDYDRPLSSRGRQEAWRVGEALLQGNVPLPDLILVSSSVRTKQTLNIVLGRWMVGFDDDIRDEFIRSRVRYNEELYNLSEEGYLEYLISVLSSDGMFGANDDMQLNRLMIVGHNPAMERLLNELVLVDNKTSQPLHYSTGELFELNFPNLSTWEDLTWHRHTGEIVLHVAH